MTRGPHFSDSQAALFAHDEAPPPPDNRGLPSYIRDHRARLRERFRIGGADALPDYELLELVLFRAIPRRDVKPLARLLLETFGDFNAVVSAPPARLAAMNGSCCITSPETTLCSGFFSVADQKPAQVPTSLQPA